MDSMWKNTLWQQFGAAIDMLENAMVACPEDLWNNRSLKPEFWYTAFHALFWLDFYLSESPEGFIPPPPFALEELDPAGVLPPRVYTRNELQAYLNHGRKKCRTTIQALTDEGAGRRHVFGSVDLSFGELLLYNMRHVQHHAGQLNLLLRQAVDSSPRWVKKTRTTLEADS